MEMGNDGATNKNGNNNESKNFKKDKNRINFLCEHENNEYVSNLLKKRSFEWCHDFCCYEFCFGRIFLLFVILSVALVLCFEYSIRFEISTTDGKTVLAIYYLISHFLVIVFSILLIFIAIHLDINDVWKEYGWLTEHGIMGIAASNHRYMTLRLCNAYNEIINFIIAFEFLNYYIGDYWFKKEILSFLGMQQIIQQAWDDQRNIIISKKKLNDKEKEHEKDKEKEKEKQGEMIDVELQVSSNDSKENKESNDDKNDLILRLDTNDMNNKNNSNENLNKNENEKKKNLLSLDQLKQKMSGGKFNMEKKNKRVNFWNTVVKPSDVRLYSKINIGMTFDASKKARSKLLDNIETVLKYYSSLMYNLTVDSKATKPQNQRLYLQFE